MKVGMWSCSPPLSPRGLDGGLSRSFVWWSQSRGSQRLGGQFTLFLIAPDVWSLETKEPRVVSSGPRSEKESLALCLTGQRVSRVFWRCADFLSVVWIQPGCLGNVKVNAQDGEAVASRSKTSDPRSPWQHGGPSRDSFREPPHARFLLREQPCFRGEIAGSVFSKSHVGTADDAGTNAVVWQRGRRTARAAGPGRASRQAGARHADPSRKPAGPWPASSSLPSRHGWLPCGGGTLL